MDLDFQRPPYIREVTIELDDPEPHGEEYREALRTAFEATGIGFMTPIIFKYRTTDDRWIRLPRIGDVVEAVDGPLQIKFGLDANSPSSNMQPPNEVLGFDDRIPLTNFGEIEIKTPCDVLVWFAPWPLRAFIRDQVYDFTAGGLIAQHTSGDYAWESIRRRPYCAGPCRHGEAIELLFRRHLELRLRPHDAMPSRRGSL